MFCSNISSIYWKSTMQNSKYELPALKVIQKDFNLLQDLTKTFELPLLDNYPNKPFKQISLSNGSEEYKMIHNKFSTTENKHKISQVHKIENHFILLHYHIAKSKFLSQNDEFGFEEEFYFHGTGQENLTSICEFNFDRSKIITHKFGKGISFAKNSSYATHYPKKCKKNNKVMVLAKMFYANPLENGCKETIVPKAPASYTSKNKTGTVLVKYDDASYYPAYVIYYHRKHNKEYVEYDDYVDEDENENYDDECEDYYDELYYYNDEDYYEDDYNNEDEDSYESAYDYNHEDDYDNTDKDYHDNEDEDHYDNVAQDYYDDDHYGEEDEQNHTWDHVYSADDIYYECEDYYDEHYYDNEDYYEDDYNNEDEDSYYEIDHNNDEDDSDNKDGDYNDNDHHGEENKHYYNWDQIYNEDDIFYECKYNTEDNVVHFHDYDYFDCSTDSDYE
ncbi:unnamed protein product [Ceutorhynchus assimilis]|uniref:Poly [ADP-ribose] polymerase n=1 Tax=Ceutorhynchus assimilis TaxID=467358 RepID=A0A9P0DLW3_9CUCU|nr:unnamed protein product [Ceutorhynchus assimilis]